MRISDWSSDVCSSDLLRDAAIFQILHQPRLIDRGNRPEPHADGRKLPEVRHQPRMRIARKARRQRFHPEALELLFRNASFEKRARVNARRDVTLNVDQIDRKSTRLNSSH